MTGGAGRGYPERMPADAGSLCPGCGLEMPRGAAVYDRKFHASAECWALFEEVLAAEYQNAVLFGQVHQLTVDAYAVQHAGGRHPDKSVCIHLCGLYLVLERRVAPTAVPPRLQAIAARTSWPSLGPPAGRVGMTVFDVAITGSPQEHAAASRAWALAVWRHWAPHHDVARELAVDVAG